MQMKFSAARAEFHYAGRYCTRTFGYRDSNAARRSEGRVIFSKILFEATENSARAGDHLKGKSTKTRIVSAEIILRDYSPSVVDARYYRFYAIPSVSSVENVRLSVEDGTI